MVVPTSDDCKIFIGIGYIQIKYLYNYKHFTQIKSTAVFFLCALKSSSLSQEAFDAMEVLNVFISSGKE
jgi:hypothetical protein